MWALLFVSPIAGYNVVSLIVFHFRHETLWQATPIWAHALGVVVFILALILLYISLENINLEEEIERADYLIALDGLQKIIADSSPDILEERAQDYLDGYQGRKFFFDLLNHQALKLDGISME